MNRITRYLLIACCLLPLLPARAQEEQPGPRVIVVLFGGGLRNLDSIDDPEHRFIPRLWNDLVPQGTLFTNMRVEHKVVHPNSAGSVVTGHWEWDDLDWSHPVDHPTLYEIYRKARKAPDTDAWAFIYASILAGTGLSRAGGYGKEFAANVLEPPTIPRSTAEAIDSLMRAAAATGSQEAEIQAAEEAAALVRKTSVITRGGLRSPAARAFLDKQFAAFQGGTGTTSHDAFLTDCAIAAMEQFSPHIVTVMYGEIDCAHYGSWSRYTEAIARTDALTARLWETAQRLPAYKGNTLMLILPDHGRELDETGGLGFIHHSDFYTDTGADEGCRRVWMLALGPTVPKGKRIEAPTPLTTVAPTALEYLGLRASTGAAGSVWKALK